jgi:hypothetical protein
MKISRDDKNRSGGTGRRGRGFCATGAALVALAALLAGVAGCDDAMMKEFRGAATDSLQTGMTSIADGVISGLFAIVQTDSSSSTDTGNGG